MKSNIIDASARLTQKRKFDQFLDGVNHSETYTAVSFKEAIHADCKLHIEVYSGASPGLCIAAGNDSWLVTLTRAQAVQLAKDLFSSIE